MSDEKDEYEEEPVMFQLFAPPPTPEERLAHAKKIDALKKSALPLVEEILKCGRDLYTLGVHTDHLRKIQKHAALFRELLLAQDPLE